MQSAKGKTIKKADEAESTGHPFPEPRAIYRYFDPYTPYHE
jgi:hypothetical protein